MHCIILLLRIYRMGQLPQQWASILIMIVIVVYQVQKSVSSSPEDDVELGSGINIDVAITINVANIRFVEEVDNELSSPGTSVTAQGDETEKCNSSDGRGCGPEASKQRSSGTILEVSALLWMTLYGVFLILQLSLT